MFNPYALEKFAEQRRSDAERAAAAYRLAVQAERAARVDGSLLAPHVRAGRFLQRVARLMARRPARAYSVTPKPQPR